MSKLINSILFFFYISVVNISAQNADTSINFIIFKNEKLQIYKSNVEFKITNADLSKTIIFTGHYIPGTLVFSKEIIPFLNDTLFEIHLILQLGNDSYTIPINNQIINLFANWANPVSNIYFIYDLDIIKYKIRFSKDVQKQKEYLFEYYKSGLFNYLPRSFLNRIFRYKINPLF